MNRCFSSQPVLVYVIQLFFHSFRKLEENRFQAQETQIKLLMHGTLSSYILDILKFCCPLKNTVPDKIIKLTVFTFSDAIAKELYSRVFTWLVNRINGIVFHGKQGPSIAILDIFGFEVN